MMLEKRLRERKQVVLQANIDGEKEYSQILAKGELECSELKKTTSIKKAAMNISKLVYEKYKEN